MAQKNDLDDTQSIFSESESNGNELGHLLVDEKEVFAIVDDMNMDNFDELLPKSNRAIVYPFELDDFQKRACYRLE
jgi:superfamily II RNA helicase